MISVVAGLLASLLLAAPARAHETRPLAITLEETAPDQWRLSWRMPGSIGSESAPTLALEGCRRAEEVAPPVRALEGASLWRCDGPPTVVMDYPAYNPSVSALIRAIDRDGATTTAAIPPSATRWSAPMRQSAAATARAYFVIGVEHILGGVDHILFLLALLYIARRPMRVLATVTGFTLGHATTIVLVSLGLLRVSVPAVEAAIALSIVFVAAEIARTRRDTLAWRRPALVAAGFGLAHGAGFAAALGEIGLPQTARALALAAFNVGVEAGQILIVALVFGFVATARASFAGAALPTGAPQPRHMVGYPLGVIAAYWFAERFVSAVA